MLVNLFTFGGLEINYSLPVESKNIISSSSYSIKFIGSEVVFLDSAFRMIDEIVLKEDESCTEPHVKSANWNNLEYSSQGGRIMNAIHVK